MIDASIRLTRTILHKAWMLLGIPIWCFTEEGPIGYVAGRLTDAWIVIGDEIHPKWNRALPPKREDR